MKKLCNERLELTFANENDYKAARFDHCGIIKSVVLDGKYSFMTNESVADDGLSQTRGIGLCSEFGLESALGFEEDLDIFMKIGVGEVYRNPDKNSAMMMLAKNPNTKPDIKSTFSADTATFNLSQKSDNGYAYDYAKKIALVGNSIEIYISLKNTGEKFIDTSEYFHNFVNLNGEEIDENYVATVDSIPNTWHDKPVGQLQIDKNSFTFPKKVNTVFYARAYNPNGMTSWTLTNKKTGLGMSEKSKNEVTRFAIWGVEHVFSCELFTDVKIAPGEIYTNKRTFSFFTEE